MFDALPWAHGLVRGGISFRGSWYQRPDWFSRKPPIPSVRHGLLSTRPVDLFWIQPHVNMSYQQEAGGEEAGFLPASTLPKDVRPRGQHPGFSLGPRTDPSPSSITFGRQRRHSANLSLLPTCDWAREPSHADCFLCRSPVQTQAFPRAADPGKMY